MRVADTNIFSYIFKQDTRAELYRPHLDGHLLALSFMSVAELDRWALGANWRALRRQKLEAHLKRYLIQSYTRALGQQWAAVMVEAKRAGRPIGVADAWIAATALHFTVPLVTHNADDFAGVSGLSIITENK